MRANRLPYLTKMISQEIFVEAVFLTDTYMIKIVTITKNHATFIRRGYEARFPAVKVMKFPAGTILSAVGLLQFW